MAGGAELVRAGKEKVKEGLTAALRQLRDRLWSGGARARPFSELQKERTVCNGDKPQQGDPDQINRTKTRPSERFSTGTRWPETGTGRISILANTQNSAGQSSGQLDLTLKLPLFEQEDELDDLQTYPNLVSFCECICKYSQIFY